MTRPGIEPRPPGPLANTLTARPMSGIILLKDFNDTVYFDLRPGKTCHSRLMHRKRVTCELHDSYFRLMTIKHAIPNIEWAIELLYNSVKTRSQTVRVGESC